MSPRERNETTAAPRPMSQLKYMHITLPSVDSKASSAGLSQLPNVCPCHGVKGTHELSIHNQRQFHTPRTRQMITHGVNCKIDHAVRMDAGLAQRGPATRGTQFEFMGVVYR